MPDTDSITKSDGVALQHAAGIEKNRRKPVLFFVPAYTMCVEIHFTLRNNCSIIIIVRVTGLRFCHCRGSHIIWTLTSS